MHFPTRSEHASLWIRVAVVEPSHNFLLIRWSDWESTHQARVLKDLWDALYHKVADKWKAVGVLLEIPKGTLAGIL